MVPSNSDRGRPTSGRPSGRRVLPPASPSSIAGWPMSSAAGSPNRRWLATARGTKWSPGSSTRRRRRWRTACGVSPSAVGVGPRWHEHVLAELGVIHLIAVAGRRLPQLDEDLADSVRSALGWTIRQADVLARAPETDRWFVAGRSDVLEDRIVVRRSWLRGLASREWALLLSFAAYGQSLDGGVPVGTVLHADLHRYPGCNELRCVLGVVHAAPAAHSEEPVTTSLAGACDEIGSRLAGVPWLERWPVTVAAAPTLAGGSWSLVDHTGSVPLAPGRDAAPTLAAVSGGRPVAITAEWTAEGFVPLAVHGPGRSIDVGPRGGFHERQWGRAS